MRFARGDERDLRAAIECFDAALTVRTRADWPEEWADTQRAKGNALRHLREGGREWNLHDALVCFEGALEVYTRQEHGWRWAHTLCEKSVGAVRFARERFARGATARRI